MCVRVCLHAGSVAIIAIEVMMNILTTYTGLLQCLDADVLMLVFKFKAFVHFISYYVRNI